MRLLLLGCQPPDYVNVTAADAERPRQTIGYSAERSGTYLPDNRDPIAHPGLRRPLTGWESVLKFVIRGVEEK